MDVDDFDFNLPASCIAQRPARPRDAARLLVVGGELGDRRVSDLPQILRPGDLLVLNDTKVLPSRLTGQRGDVRVEATLIAEEAPGCWSALAKPGRRLRLGDRIAFAADLAAVVRAKRPEGDVLLDFGLARDALMAALDVHGAAPLPPYIRRTTADPHDRDDYQTVYAAHPGAVAAPTAGLHFTPRLLDALAAAGIGRALVTLHVGAGTFLPVKTPRVEDHVMHAEAGEISEQAAAAIAETRARGGRIVAVGTTALRLLETAAAMTGDVRAWTGRTALFILPGHRFRAVDLLLTNFHLPRSTLFMLVCAFAGRERMHAAYRHAIAGGYRFYSYGDACLLHPEDACQLHPEDACQLHPEDACQLHPEDACRLHPEDARPPDPEDARPPHPEGAA